MHAEAPLLTRPLYQITNASSAIDIGPRSFHIYIFARVVEPIAREFSALNALPVCVYARFSNWKQIFIGN